MKAITIKQPWASLIALGEKKIETRSWKTSYRGTILIHAGKGIEKSICSDEPFCSVLKQHEIETYNDFPLGMIIAKADLIDCIEITWNNNVKCIAGDEKGNVIARNNEWFFGGYDCEEEKRFAWILENVKLINPIPAKGQLSLWNFKLECEE